MKQFDLSAAIRGDKVLDNAGGTSIDFKFWETESRIEFLFKRNDVHNYYMSYHLNGEFNGLHMAPTKKKGWINLYPDGHSNRTYLFLSTNVYTTKEEAFESRVNSSKSIQIEIEWEE